MVNTFYADPAVGGDASTTTDDASGTTGLANDGFRTRLLPMFTNVVAIANFVIGRATAAASSASAASASAASAANAPGTSATTTSSVTVGTGSKSFTLAQTGKAFSVGQTVVCASAASPTNSITGPITAFNSGTGAMTINSTAASGSGTFTDGVVSLSAVGGVLPTRQVATTGLATGGGDLSADRTINVPAAVAADVRTGTDTTKAVTAAALMGSSAHGVLTDAATVAWDVRANGYNAYLVLTATGHTIGAPSNLSDGQFISLDISSGVGGFTLAWNTIWDFALVGVPTMPTAASKVLTVTGKYNSTTGKIRASASQPA